MTSWTDRPTVGVVGLGRVGWTCARALLAADLQVVGYQRRGTEALIDLGGVGVGSPGEVLERCEVVLLAVPSANALRDVVEGTHGLREARSTQSRVVVDLTTTELSEKERARAALAAVGVDMLDCPVGGTPSEAAPSAMDTMFVSGDEAVYRRCREVLHLVASRVRYVGAFGSGATMKLVANTLVALNTAALAEALGLGVRAGLDPEAMLTCLGVSPGTSWVFHDRARRMLEGPHRPARGSIDMLRKDLTLIERLAQQAGMSMPLTQTAQGRYDAAHERGWGDDDVSVLYRLTGDP